MFNWLRRLRVRTICGMSRSYWCIRKLSSTPNSKEVKWLLYVWIALSVLLQQCVSGATDSTLHLWGQLQSITSTCFGKPEGVLVLILFSSIWYQYSCCPTWLQPFGIYFSGLKWWESDPFDLCTWLFCCLKNLYVYIPMFLAWCGFLFFFVGGLSGMNVLMLLFHVPLLGFIRLRKEFVDDFDVKVRKCCQVAIVEWSYPCCFGWETKSSM